ncbi:AraC family transcriptional regulator [Lacrimispora sp. JR3]|uniref:AraC family transcriptional regulator n=1 Tax=Lacrimispora sinapis TaxID=3111456 RepID=UPI00374A66E1
MNIQTLNKHLSTLTLHEQQYREGKFYDFSKLEIVDVIENQNIYRMDVSYNLTNNMFSVKKNSRFQPVPPHVHSWVEINYMYSGSCEQMINGKSLILHTGEIILIDCETVHAIGYTGENDIMINLLIPKDYLNNTFLSRLSSDSLISRFFINAMNSKTDHNSFIVFHSSHSRRLPVFMNELLCEYYSPSMNSAEILDHLFSLVVSELVNVFGHDMSNNLDKNSSFSIIPVLKYIESNYQTSTLEKTAAFFNINPNYLTTLLKRQTGHSYKELILMSKMKAAQKLLSCTRLSVKEVALHVGYDNLTFFYRKFQEYYHCTPNEYRRKKNGE